MPSLDPEIPGFCPWGPWGTYFDDLELIIDPPRADLGAHNFILRDGIICVWLCLCIYMYAYMHICIYIYIYAYMHICRYIYMHIYIHIYIYAYIHIYIYIYIIYIYTYLDPQIPGICTPSRKDSFCLSFSYTNRHFRAWAPPGPDSWIWAPPPPSHPFISWTPR